MWQCNIYATVTKTLQGSFGGQNIIRFWSQKDIDAGRFDTGERNANYSTITKESSIIAGNGTFVDNENLEKKPEH
jgi:hypothetical protein